MQPSAPEIRITRTIDAPVGKVFQAWTDVTLLKQWFAASDSYSSPTAEVDLKVGGH